MAFLSSRCLTKVKVILWLNEIKNGSPLMNNMSAVINTSLWSLMSSLGILTMSPDTWIGFFLVVLHFKASMFLPQIACEMSISWTVTGQSIICRLWTIHLKYLTDGYPSLEYNVFAWSSPLIFPLENPCLFLELVFS